MRYDILGFGTGVGESFFLSDFFECGAKDFPVDEGVEFGQEVVELIDFTSCVSTSKNEGGRRGIKKRRKKGVSKKNTPFSNPVEMPRIFRGALEVGIFDFKVSQSSFDSEMM